LNAKFRRERIFKQTVGSESLHQDGNDDYFRIVNFAISKNVVLRSTVFPPTHIHKYTWTSPNKKTHNQIDHMLIDNRWHSSVPDYDLSGELTVILITIWCLQKLRKDFQSVNKQYTNFMRTNLISCI
jgi:hypothetical protein